MTTTLLIPALNEIVGLRRCGAVLFAHIVLGEFPRALTVRMMMALHAFRMGILMALCLTAASSVAAETPASPPASCDDRFRDLSVYADILGRSRTRGELEAAKMIMDLVRQRDAAVKELEQLKRSSR